MTEYTHKPGNGSLFAGDKDKPAAWSGKVCLPDGTMAFIDLYRATDRETGALRKDKNGMGWYNVRVKVMDAQGGGDSERNKGRSDFAPHVPDLDDSDIPF
jgi:hypothetical protein